MSSTHAKRYALLWIAIGVALLFPMHWLYFLPASDIANLRFPSTAREAIAILQALCFVFGISALFVGFMQLFASPVTPQLQVNRRHAPRDKGVGFFLILGFIFSIVGLAAWLLPIQRDEKILVEALTPIIGFAFGLMTLLAALGIVLSIRQQRVFDRRAVAGISRATKILR